MFVMDMEDGKIIREPAAAEAETRTFELPQYPQPQPRLQRISLPPKVALPPLPLDFDATFTAFDA
jgi:hypothetical protein